MIYSPSLCPAAHHSTDARGLGREGDRESLLPRLGFVQEKTNYLMNLIQGPGNNLSSPKVRG